MNPMINKETVVVRQAHKAHELTQNVLRLVEGVFKTIADRYSEHEQLNIK